MDSFQINNIKVEKANKILKNRQLRKVANLFRLVEICVLLVLISRFTTQVPVAVKSSSEYFKDLSIMLVSPCFVFIVGNAIVITLFAKSGQFSTQDSTTKNSRNDLYEEFVQKSEKSQDISRYEVEYRGKQNICEDSTRTSREAKNYRRSQSENLKRVNSDKPCKELRRMGTEKYIKTTDSAERLVKNSFPEDNMSNEEFRCTIEAFIERQKRFRREEDTYVI